MVYRTYADANAGDVRPITPLTVPAKSYYRVLALTYSHIHLGVNGRAGVVVTDGTEVVAYAGGTYTSGTASIERHTFLARWAGNSAVDLNATTGRYVDWMPCFELPAGWTIAPNVVNPGGSNVFDFRVFVDDLAYGDEAAPYYCAAAG